MKSIFREPFNGLSHLIGALLSVVGLVALLRLAILYGTTAHIISFAIFGASLILLYTASSLYHLLKVPEKVQQILRNIDHMMIYILIAGSYTPFCILAIGGSTGRNLLIIVWTIAILGVITTNFVLKVPRWFYTLIYVFMGWLIVAKTPLIINSIGRSGFNWLLVGGILYSVGAIIYALKRPKFTSMFIGFHEIFHIFIMAGSFCHYWAVATKLI